MHLYNKKETNMSLKTGKNVIFNGHIFYTKIAKPALKYGEQPASTPHGNREYVVDVLVTEDDYKALKKKYKTVKSVKEAKEFDAKEFEAQFKCAPPFEAETYFVIKFKKSADYKDGNATQKPIVKGVKGVTGISVTTEIGNGTEAHVQWKERPWEYQGKKGLSLDLAAIGVVSLVEYTGGGTEIEFDFEDEDASEFDDDIPSEVGGEAPFEADTPAPKKEDDGW